MPRAFGNLKIGFKEIRDRRTGNRRMTSKIEWTNETWNPVTGCSKVSEGCKHCYAEREWARLSANPKTVYHGRKFTDVMFHPERLDQPLRWKKPRMIFVNSMSDLGHESIPLDFTDRVFGYMNMCRRHTFQILTKRPKRLREVVLHALDEEGLSVFPNVWLGVSVEDQETADERIPLLLETPAAVRFVSYEPALGPVDLSRWVIHPRLDWVIAGGESGPKARPSHPDWFRTVRDQCQAAGVPFFFKQWGEWLPAASGHGGPARGAWGGDRFLYGWGDIQDNDNNMVRAGKRALGSRTLDGVVHDARPEICQQ